MGIKFYDKFLTSFMHVQLVQFSLMVKISLSPPVLFTKSAIRHNNACSIDWAGA